MIRSLPQKLVQDIIENSTKQKLQFTQKKEERKKIMVQTTKRPERHFHKDLKRRKTTILEPRGKNQFLDLGRNFQN